MLYLILAIVSSALIALIMRFSETKKKSSAGMFIANYFVCMVLAFFYMGTENLMSKQEGMSIAVLLGVFSGVLYLVSFVLLQTNIAKNGVVLAAIFMKLGVIVPILSAIFIFREVPKTVQILGVLVAVTAIIVINYEPRTPDLDDMRQDNGNLKDQKLNENISMKKQGSKVLLLVLLLGSGITDSMANVYDKVGKEAFSDMYLFTIFLSALICSVILYVVKKERLCKWDILFGAMIGVPNYFSSRFLLMALSRVPAVVAYPVYSVATIVLISVVGVLLFREKLSKQKLLGLSLVVVALVLLNL